MSTVANPINASSATPGTQHRLTNRAVDASIKSFAQGKVDTSAVPTNQVEATWQDALDMVNPLQQIPLVGDIYRTLSGDKISGLARVAGGFLWGGFAGGFSAAVTAAYAEANNDQSPSEQMVAALFGTDDAPAPPEAAPPTMLAAVTPETPAAAPSPTPSAPPVVPLAAVTPTPPAQNSAPAQLAAAATPENTPDEAPPTPPAQKLQAGPPVFTASLPAAGLPTTGLPKTPDMIRTASSESLTVETLPGMPLRERLNRKNASTVSPTAKPLEQYAPSWATPKAGTSFIAQIPAQAATRSAAQNQNLAQNLQLLQGVADTPASTNVTPLPAPLDAEAFDAGTNDPELADSGLNTATTGTLLAPVTSAQHNPLPLQLVQDMMLQALDKYQNMHTPAATTGGLGLQ